MNDSTPNSSLSQDQTLIDQDDNKSVWTSSVSVEKCNPVIQTPTNKPRWKRRSFKSANKGLITFRDLDRTSSSIKPKKLAKSDQTRDQDYSTTYSDIQHAPGINTQDNYLLIRFMDLLTPGSARKIPSTHIRGAYHLVICFEIIHTKVSNPDIVVLNPVHFEARCNPIKTGSSLLIGAVNSLSPEETLLEEGTLSKLAHELLIPDIGDTVFQWLRQTSLFKDSKEDKAPKIIRNYRIFPKYTNVKSPKYTPSKFQEDRKSPTSDYSSISSLSTSTINESSIKLLGMLKRSSTERQEKVSNSLLVGPEIQEYVQQQIQRKLDQFLKSINTNALDENANKPSNDEGITGLFRGRGPRKNRKTRTHRSDKRETLPSEPHETVSPPSAPSAQCTHYISDKRESPPPETHETTVPLSVSPVLCTHYIQWLNPCFVGNHEYETSSSGVRNQNRTLSCDDCSKPIPQVAPCCHSMCGKNYIVCSNCLLVGTSKCQNLALLSPVASYQALERVLPEYPYRNPYEKLDHESINTANGVGEVRQPLNFNRVPVVIASNNYSGYESDTMHGGSSPSVYGMQFSPDEYQSPCSTPDHWLESYRETIENEIEESKNSKNQYESYLENVYLANNVADESQLDQHLTGQFKGRGIGPAYKASHTSSLTPSKPTSNSSHNNIPRTSKGSSKSQISVI